jgi:outer membrane protein assembly factor BamB
LARRRAQKRRTLRVAWLVAVAAVLLVGGSLCLLWPVVNSLRPAPEAELLWSSNLSPEGGALHIKCMAVGSDGTVYVGGVFDPNVHLVSSGGDLVGRVPVPTGRGIGHVKGLAVDADGRLMVLTDADSGGLKEQVLFYSPSGEIEGRALCEFMSDGLAAGPPGSVYVGRHNGVQKINSAGETVRICAVHVGLNGLAGVDQEGNIYLVDSGALQQVRADGSMGWKVGGDKLCLIGAATVAPDGSIYAATTSLQGRRRARSGTEVRKYDTEGSPRGRWFCESKGMGMGDSMAADGKGHVYVADPFEEISKYRLPGDKPGG